MRLLPVILGAKRFDSLLDLPNLSVRGVGGNGDGGTGGATDGVLGSLGTMFSGLTGFPLRPLDGVLKLRSGNADPCPDASFLNRILSLLLGCFVAHLLVLPIFPSYK